MSRKYKYILGLLVLFVSFTSNLSFSYSQEIKPTPEKVDYKKLHNADKYYWVIYDNVCPYCKNATKHIKTLDWEKKIKFLSYRSSLTYRIFPELSREECEKDVHMVTPKGEILKGYQVFRTIIDNLTATKILNPLLKNDYAEKQLNEIYEKMVKERTCYYNKAGACDLKTGKKIENNR